MNFLRRNKVVSLLLYFLITIFVVEIVTELVSAQDTMAVVLGVLIAIFYIPLTKWCYLKINKN